jgi:threonyl-tRNA synthetase
MIHRALLGSIERFFGILIEHYAGNFPPWLAPVQARILPLSEKFNDYAHGVAAQLRQAVGLGWDVKFIDEEGDSSGTRGTADVALTETRTLA